MSYIYKQMALYTYKQMLLHQYKLMLHMHQFYQLFTTNSWAVIGPLRGSFSRKEQGSRECFGASLRRRPRHYFRVGAEQGEAIGAGCYHARMLVRLKEGFAFNSQDAVASYEGTGYLAIENGARIACQFRADQDGNSMVQLLCHRILPNEFAFHLLALLDTGGSAGFRGTTAAGLTVVMDTERGGRPLSLDSDGYGSMYFLPGKIAVFDKEPPTNSHRYLLTC